MKLQLRIMVKQIQLIPNASKKTIILNFLKISTMKKIVLLVWVKIKFYNNVVWPYHQNWSHRTKDKWNLTWRYIQKHGTRLKTNNWPFRNLFMIKMTKLRHFNKMIPKPRMWLNDKFVVFARLDKMKITSIILNMSKSTTMTIKLIKSLRWAKKTFLMNRKQCMKWY